MVGGCSSLIYQTLFVGSLLSLLGGKKLAIVHMFRRRWESAVSNALHYSILDTSAFFNDFNVLG